MQTKKTLAALLVLLFLFTYTLTITGGASDFLGDVNGNGKIDEADADLLLYLSARLKVSDARLLIRSDIDSSGIIDASDARLILRHSLQTAAQTRKADADKDRVSVNVFDPADVPEYAGEPYYTIGNGDSALAGKKLKTNVSKSYSPLDELGRASRATACIGPESLPAERRASVPTAFPTGWIQNTYICTNDRYLYDYCRLIGPGLSEDVTNACNIISGTQYLCNKGILPLENKVADYIRKTHNHVYYCVTPIFDGDNLLASGVTVDAYSIEDEGTGINFYIYCYNVQPGVIIDYTTGQNRPEGNQITVHILDKKTKMIHRNTCAELRNVKEENTMIYAGPRNELLSHGYKLCEACDP